MAEKNRALIERNSIFWLIALGTGAILLIPLAAMQFTNEVTWELNDFLVAGLVIYCFSALCVLVARRVEENNRFIVKSIILFLFIWLWAELAVGVFTDWGS